MGKRFENFIKEDTDMANKQVKWCSKSLVIKEMKTKTEWDSYRHLLEWLKLKRLAVASDSQDMEDMELSHTTGGIGNDAAPLEKFGSFLKCLTYTDMSQPFCLGNTGRSESPCPYKHLYAEAHSCFICVIKWEQPTCVTISQKWMSKLRRPDTTDDCSATRRNQLLIQLQHGRISK